MEEKKMKKGFKITIYGVADYTRDNFDGNDEFLEYVNGYMSKIVNDLRGELKGKTFKTKSTYSNVEILGHSNNQYPDQLD